MKSLADEEIGGGSLRIGILGLGVMGRQHARALRHLSNTELVVTSDVSDEACSWAKARSKIPHVSRLEDLLAFELDGVINATPTGMHLDTTRQLLEAGVNTLVEKPIALNPSSGRELARLARAYRALLLVGHIERFNPAVVALKRLIQSGTLGDIISVYARRVGVARPVVPDTDVTLDLAIHDIDVIAYLLDRDGRLVLASGSRLHPNLVTDHADLVLRYGDAIAFIQANWITPVKIRRLSVTGTRGSAEVDYIAQTVHVYEAVPELIKGDAWDFYAVAKESEPREIQVSRREPLLLELQHFVNCIAHGTRPAFDDEEALKALTLAYEAHQKIRSGDR